MKGTLHKTEQGWVVEYAKHSELPLHHDDESLWMFAELKEGWKDKLDGKEVEFEIVKVWERNTDRNIPTLDDFEHYAKLIPSKEQQKQFITEIIEEDAKDGLYEDDVERFSFKHELQNLINEHSMENGSDTPDFILASFLYSCLESFNHAVRQREQFYNKAKETLYTDLINWIDNEMLLNEQYKDSPRLKEGATMVKVHIQSLKQPKKD